LNARTYHDVKHIVDFWEEALLYLVFESKPLTILAETKFQKIVLLESSGLRWRQKMYWGKRGGESEVDGSRKGRDGETV